MPHDPYLVHSKPVKKKRKSQQSGTGYILLMLVISAVAMAFYNAWSTKTDIRMATGPASKQQGEFFVEAADRPDIATLFKSMTAAQKVRMARNIAKYDHPKLAELIGILLADFDAEARKELAKSLAKIAEKQPEALAKELKNAGSFQNLGVTEALKAIGDRAIPYVVKQLSDGDCRPQAIAFLVENPASIPPLIACLDDKNPDVAKAAVEALGKLRAAEATSKLMQMYQASKKEDKLLYLTSLASIGDPRSENLLTIALDDPELDSSMKQQAALGLGRIASPTSIRRLWRIVPDPDVDLVDSTISALQLAGDASLKVLGTPPDVRIRVAAGVASPLADLVIAEGIRNPDIAIKKIALQSAQERPGLVGALVSFLKSIQTEEDGEVIDYAVTALVSTPQGVREAQSLKSNELLVGFIERSEQARS